MKKRQANRVSQGRRQRLQFIESRLIWTGSFRRREICEAFGLTPNHVTREITAYRKAFKDNLVCDPDTRVWSVGRSFRPAYVTGDPAEYLRFLHGYALSGDSSIMTTVGPVVSAEALPPVTSRIDGDVLKEILRAISRGTGVLVRYQSFSDSEPTERTLWPHAMAYAHDRWHVRAYDSRREKFGDFVLPRILKVRSVETTNESAAPSADEDWSTYVTLELIPTPTLSESQVAAVVREYGMRRVGSEWIWKVSIRRCLAPYFLEQHRLDLPAKSARHRRIALRESALAERYRFVDD